ncbi:malectin isoform X2 [Alligator mississippiensis]|uniref:malectin isoform X2 n=1 Tax=Alligator mississippiensis TaxID=8496 RepID=UPI0028774734|nr:malectin isoform X2 [Alligator mississippiensis]
MVGTGARCGPGAALLLGALLGAAVAAAAGGGLADNVVWAVNAGGEGHVDVHGIHFRKDPLEGRVGRASDYGMKLPILRSNAEDQILYQTERYNEETFGYEIPIKEEGDYVLVLKFAEVYFAQSQQKMFQSCSLTQAWRKRRMRMMKRSMKKAPMLKNRPIRTGFSRVPAHQTLMPQTTAASCSLYWWPLVSSSLPSSACAGCEREPYTEAAVGTRGRELDRMWLLSMSSKLFII